MALNLSFFNLFRPTWDEITVGMIAQHTDGRIATIYGVNGHETYADEKAGIFKHYVSAGDLEGGEYWSDDEIAHVWYSMEALAS